MDNESKFIDEKKELAGETETAEFETAGEVDTETKVESPPPESPEPSSEDKTHPEWEIAEDGKVRIGEHEFENVDIALQSFRDLQVLQGRQTTELGELRKKVASVSEPEPEPEEELTYDPYDQDSVDTYIEKKVGGIFKNMSQKAWEAQRVTTTLEKLKEGNPKMTDEDWMEVARFGDERGVRRFDDALYLMQKEAVLKEAKESGRKEVLSELAKGGELPPSLANKGTGGGQKRDAAYYENLSQEDWDNLPEDERKHAMALQVFGFITLTIDRGFK